MADAAIAFAVTCDAPLSGDRTMTDHLFLRNVMEHDLPVFFGFQLDPDANYMAAFTAKIVPISKPSSHIGTRFWAT